MADKQYLKCSAKAKQTQYGDKILLGIKVDDFIAFARKHVNDRGYVNLVISQRKEVGQYGDTHSVYLDDYRPRADSRHSEPVDDDNAPF